MTLVASRWLASLLIGTAEVAGLPAPSLARPKPDPCPSDRFLVTTGGPLFTLYVPDVDAAYTRALRCRAVSVAVPEDKPYQERNAGVRDTFGNVWWISKYLG